MSDKHNQDYRDYEADMESKALADEGMSKKFGKALIDDPSKRWTKGQVGEILENDFEKYDYKIDFGVMQDFELFEKKQINCPQVVYFYKDEIEVI